MDHVNVNRFSLSALGAVLFVMLLTAFSNLLLSSRTPKVPGFALPTSGPATEAAAGPGRAGSAAAADAARQGRRHKGRAIRQGLPNLPQFREGRWREDRPADLWNVVGRPVASIPGFAYSDSLKGIGGNWTYEALNVMVSNPKKEASGTKMAFPGEKDAQRRADILDYLQTLCRLAGPVPEVRGAGAWRGGLAEAAETTGARVCAKQIQANPSRTK